jgi:predicted SAM-dependent methyltransferase
MGLRINVGCGITPTPGWINLDNSPSVRIANWRPLAKLLLRTPFLPLNQREFISQAMAHRIRCASATKLPFPDGSVEVIYSSHMMEHLHRTDTALFLQEARRVLAPDGIIRLALPDLRRLAIAYLNDGDADTFLESTLLSPDHIRSKKYRLLSLVWGERHHLWMYDGASLIKILTAHGFRDAQILEAGKTIISDPGMLNLAERIAESVYVEARR